MGGRNRESAQDVVPALISQEFATHAPMIIEQLFRIHMQNTDVLRAKYEKSSTSAGPCRFDSFCKHDHDEHQADDGYPEGYQQEWDAWVEDTVIDEDGIKINLTAPTLIFLGIEAKDPYSIIDEPILGLIYLNNKEEKKVMDLVEIVKFCDATLERVLKEVKLKIFETESLKKAPVLESLDLKIMKTYEREFMKRLRHREQMRRWELFVNGRPILSTMRRQ
ncbi:hypothetical protein Tco_0678314 [Tanacetum coccineum]|uniref:Uncharacterized protein n=1 Tax=Tanacetum coccineum TaxID=301880 RepID=A0ABQ4XEP3_9ASTR